jgi:hypothetical protein
MIGKIFKFIVIGFLALIGIGIGISLIGVAIALAVKIAVLAVIGFGVYKLVGGGKSTPKEPQISEADRKWLES